MKPIGPSMWEHRLIERMVALVKQELAGMNKTGQASAEFIEIAVDFFRTYADRTHHGKEEDILFRELAKKPLSPEHKKIMDGLVEDHILGRKLVSSLAIAREKYTGGTGALGDVQTYLNKLAKFYPRHIEVEDKHFFHPSMEYFSRQEQDAMLQEFWEFDRKLIHEKYQKLVEKLAKGAA